MTKKKCTGFLRAEMKFEKVNSWTCENKFLAIVWDAGCLYLTQGRKVHRTLQCNCCFTAAFPVVSSLLMRVFNGVCLWQIFSSNQGWFKSTEEKMFLTRAEYYFIVRVVIVIRIDYKSSVPQSFSCSYIAVQTSSTVTFVNKICIHFC